jgi:hypothetical protein
MPNARLEEFGKILVEWVRDNAIRSSDRRFGSDGATVVAKRWREASRNGATEEFVKVLIPDVVDDTIFYILQAIDQGVLKLSFRGPGGRVVNLANEGLGKLARTYMTDWRVMYTKERYADDFSDPNDPGSSSDP